MADVCPAVDEAVMLAGLVRSLVRTCHGLDHLAAGTGRGPARSTSFPSNPWREARQRAARTTSGRT